MAMGDEPGLRRSGRSGALLAAARSPVGRLAAFKAALRLEGGQHTSATAREILARYHDVEVGAYSYGECMRLGSFPAGTRVGRFVSTAIGVQLFPSDHPLDHLSMHPYFYASYLGLTERDLIQRRPVTIGHDAWIGAGVIITSGCTSIGVGSVVGAGSIVTADVPDFGIVVGNPARLVRHRFDEPTRARILESRWWERSIDEIAPHLDAMTAPLDVATHPLLAGPGPG